MFLVIFVLFLWHFVVTLFSVLFSCCDVGGFSVFGACLIHWGGLQLERGDVIPPLSSNYLLPGCVWYRAVAEGLL